MRLELADEALSFEAVVRDALGAAGGDSLIAGAEADPAAAERLVGDVLAELGVWDLDIRADETQLDAAAAACRSAGWWAAPGNVAARLARPADLDVDALAIVAGARRCAPMVGTQLRWVGVDLDGRRSMLAARDIGTSPRAAALVVPVDESHLDDGGLGDVALGLVLPMWTLLGMLDRAIDVTAGYVRDRHQFGKPLASFQAVQFQLTEAEVERLGLEELAKFSLWSAGTGRPDTVVDALAVRLAGITAADRVFRICHQLHGAIGFCDETTISWLSRYSRPLRTLPLPLSATRAELVRRAGRNGLSGLYSHGAVLSGGLV